MSSATKLAFFDAGMKLQLVADQQDDGYPEIGEVTSLFWNRERTIFAVVSVRSPGTSWTRPRFFSKHCQRVSLYDATSKRLINSYSGMHHKVLDVCFHPTDPSLIIGTGEYDGGYSLQGELVLWNWQNNKRQTLAGFPSFYRTRFISPTDIEVLISPEHEEDVEGGQDAFKTFRLVSASLVNLPDGRIPDAQLSRPLAKDVEPKDAEFTPMEMYSEVRKAFESTSQKEVAQLLGIVGGRGAVVDMLSTDSELFTIKNHPTFERRRLSGELIEVVDNPFSGAQIFPLEDRRLLINTDRYEPLHIRSHKLYGQLLIWDTSTGKMETFLEGANPFLLSQSSDGRILARSCGHYSDATSDPYRQPMGIDFLIDRQLKKKPIAPLGSANHFIYITTKGSKKLYHFGLEFPWPGWGKQPHPRLTLLTIGQDSASQVLDFADKRSTADALPMAPLQLELFCACTTLSGEDLIGGGYHWHGTNQPMKGLVWRHDLANQRWKWQSEFDERIRLLLHLPVHNAIVAGFDEGILRLLDANTGETCDEVALSFAGIPSIPMEACAHSSELFVATLEGRILRFTIV